MDLAHHLYQSILIGLNPLLIWKKKTVKKTQKCNCCSISLSACSKFRGVGTATFSGLNSVSTPALKITECFIIFTFCECNVKRILILIWYLGNFFFEHAHLPLWMSCAEVSKQAKHPKQQIEIILQNIFLRISLIQQTQHLIPKFSKSLRYLQKEKI